MEKETQKIYNIISMYTVMKKGTDFNEILRLANELSVMQLEVILSKLKMENKIAETGKGIITTI